MTTKEFTGLYTRNSRYTSKFAKNFDPNLLTFKCAAVDESDAVRLLRHSLRFSTKNAKGKVTHRTRRFKVVRVCHGDGIKRCDCAYCKSNPRFAARVTVIPSRKPRWMNRSFTGKGR